LQDNLYAEFIKELIKPRLKECSVKRSVDKEEKNCLVKSSKIISENSSLSAYIPRFHDVDEIS
jgi:hypothetical protein